VRLACGSPDPDVAQTVRGVGPWKYANTTTGAMVQGQVPPREVVATRWLSDGASALSVVGLSHS